MIKSSYLNIISTMGYRSIDSDTIDHLREYIDMLNKESENLTVFHHFRGITDFVDNYHLNRKKIILLLDMDRTGKKLTSKLVTQLQCKGNNVTLFYKRALVKITNGKVRHVEDLITYAPHLSGITGSRKDLYFYI